MKLFDEAKVTDKTARKINLSESEGGSPESHNECTAGSLPASEGVDNRHSAAVPLGNDETAHEVATEDHATTLDRSHASPCRAFHVESRVGRLIRGAFDNQSGFRPDELAPLEPAEGGIAGYHLAVERLGRSNMVPIWSEACQKVEFFEELERRAKALLGAATDEHKAAFLRLHSHRSAASPRILINQEEWRLNEAVRRRQEALASLSRNSVESWRAWRDTAWDALEADFKSRWRSDGISCFAFPAHELATTQRVPVPKSLIDLLSFSGTSATDEHGRKFVDVRFYCQIDDVTEPPALIAGGPPGRVGWGLFRLLVSDKKALLTLSNKPAEPPQTEVRSPPAEPVAAPRAEPTETPRVETAETPPADGSNAKPKAGRGAAPETRNWTEIQIRREARVIYTEFADDPPNMNRAEKLLREWLPGAKRTRIRPVLREPEFVNSRRRSGEKRNK